MEKPPTIDFTRGDGHNDLHRHRELELWFVRQPANKNPAEVLYL